MEPTFDRILLLIQLKKYDQAIQVIKEGLQNDIENPSFYHLMGICYFRKGDYLRCEQFYEKACEFGPNTSRFWISMAEVSLQLNKFYKAKEYLNRSLKLDPTIPENYSCRGMIYFKKGEVEKSLLEFDKALEINPNHQISLEMKAKAFSFLKEYDKADIMAKNALRINPNSKIALINLGWNELLKGNKERAKELFEEILQTDSSSKSALLGYKSSIRGKTKLQRFIIKKEFQLHTDSRLKMLIIIPGLILALILFFGRFNINNQIDFLLISESFLLLIIISSIPFKILPQISIIYLLQDKIGKKVISNKHRISGILSLIILVIGFILIICSIIFSGVKLFFGLLVTMIGLMIIDFGYEQIKGIFFWFIVFLIISYFVLGMFCLWTENKIFGLEFLFFIITIGYPSLMVAMTKE